MRENGRENPIVKIAVFGMNGMACVSVSRPACPDRRGGEGEQFLCMFLEFSIQQRLKYQSNKQLDKQKKTKKQKN